MKCNGNVMESADQPPYEEVRVLEAIINHNAVKGESIYPVEVK